MASPDVTALQAGRVFGDSKQKSPSPVLGRRHPSLGKLRRALAKSYPKYDAEEVGPFADFECTPPKATTLKI